MNPPNAPVVASTAAFLLIGNELLSGKVQEANLKPLAQLLRALGINLLGSSIVRDDPETITREVTRLRAVADVVFTSGGIGPTHDDVTIESIAEAFGVETFTPPHLAARLREVYGPNCTDAHLRMALVPKGADLLDDMERNWPLIRMHNVWILPGIPELFRSKLNAVRAHLRGHNPYCSEWVKLHWEEVQLKDLLDAVVSEHPGVEVGSYPKWFSDEYKTQVTFDAQSQDLVTRALRSLVSRLPKSAIASLSLPLAP
jgi:molybdenum cofactor synthesis domain-containing protein